MGKRKRTDAPHGAAGHGSAAIKAQQRILQLRKQRDERAHRVYKDFDTAMENLEARIVAHQKQQLQQIMKKRADCVVQIVQSIEKKRGVEEEMMKVVARINTLAMELEEMMVAGYQGREQDVAESLRAWD